MGEKLACIPKNPFGPNKFKLEGKQHKTLTAMVQSGKKKKARK